METNYTQQMIMTFTIYLVYFLIVLIIVSSDYVRRNEHSIRELNDLKRYMVQVLIIAILLNIILYINDVYKIENLRNVYRPYIKLFE